MNYEPDSGSYQPQDPSSYQTQHPPAWMMHQYVEGPEAPWILFNPGTSLDGQRMGPVQPPPFQQYRNHAQSVDTNTHHTLPSDSGYGSQSRAPPPDSLCGDGLLGPDLQAVGVQFDRFGLANDLVPRLTETGRPIMKPAANVAESESSLHCDHCNRRFSNKAALK